MCMYYNGHLFKITYWKRSWGIRGAYRSTDCVTWVWKCLQDCMTSGGIWFWWSLPCIVPQALALLPLNPNIFQIMETEVSCVAFILFIKDANSCISCSLVWTHGTPSYLNETGQHLCFCLDQCHWVDLAWLLWTPEVDMLKEVKTALFDKLLL